MCMEGQARTANKQQGCENPANGTHLCGRSPARATRVKRPSHTGSPKQHMYCTGPVHTWRLYCTGCSAHAVLCRLQCTCHAVCCACATTPHTPKPLAMQCWHMLLPQAFNAPHPKADAKYTPLPNVHGTLLHQQTHSNACVSAAACTHRHTQVPETHNIQAQTATHTCTNTCYVIWLPHPRTHQGDQCNCFDTGMCRDRMLGKQPLEQLEQVNKPTCRGVQQGI
jgi:hypothetical protein